MHARTHTPTNTHIHESWGIHKIGRIKSLGIKKKVGNQTFNLYARFKAT